MHLASFGWLVQYQQEEKIDHFGLKIKIKITIIVHQSESK
jgi:hypothetical protein